MITPLTTPTLPRGIRSRFVDGINGLTDARARGRLRGEGPALPAAAARLSRSSPISWRKVMLPLAAAGFHVVAPDQRGYGRTTGWDGDYDGDLGSFRMLNLVRDALGPRLGARLSLGRGRGRARLRLAGRGLVRAGAARRVPLGGADERAVRRPAAIPFDTDAQRPARRVDRARASTTSWRALDPPRKHYQWYYSTRPANADMRDCPQGVHAFLRAYYHHKSADWKRNKPLSARGLDAPASWRRCRPTTSWSSTRAWPRRVAPQMPTRGRDRGLHVAARRGARRLQRGVRAHRLPGRAATGTARARSACSTPSCRCSPAAPSTCRRASSRARATGASTRRRARSSACRRAPARAWLGCHLVDGAGHWVQQEQPEATTRLLLEFLRAAGTLR